MAEKPGATCGIFLVGLLWMAAAGLIPLVAYAQPDELRAFEEARQAYTDADYPLAVQRFEALVGGPVPTIQNSALVLESRKYLGAAYLFVGRPSDADQQFEALLTTDPAYLVPASFPEAVQEAFDSARHRLADLAATQAADDARRERARREAEMRRLVAQQDRIRRLEELASTEVIGHDNSRILALLPYGVGQFQNEDHRLGRFLAYSEGGLTLISLGTAIARAVLRSRADRLDPTFRRRARRDIILTNWAATGTLAVVAIAGVIQAQLQFRPHIRHERPRELPPRSPDDGEHEGTGVSSQSTAATPREASGAGLSLSLAPTSVAITLHF